MSDKRSNTFLAILGTLTLCSIDLHVSARYNVMQKKDSAMGHGSWVTRVISHNITIRCQLCSRHWGSRVVNIGTKSKICTVVVKVFFTVRRYALHGLSYRNSVCPSVCLSVRPSIKLVDCVHMALATIMISSPYGSPIILVSGDITLIPKFEGGHPERGR